MNSYIAASFTHQDVSWGNVPFWEGRLLDVEEGCTSAAHFYKARAALSGFELIVTCLHKLNKAYKAFFPLPGDCYPALTEMSSCHLSRVGRGDQIWTSKITKESQ